MTMKRTLMAAVAVAVTASGCSSSGGTGSAGPGPAGPSIASTSPPTPGPPASTIASSASPPAGPSAPTGGGCPVVSADAVNAAVAGEPEAHLSDHYDSTTQPPAGSPFAGSVLCDFADSVAGVTVKVARGTAATVGSVDDLLGKVQDGLHFDASACPAISGVGERAYRCADDAQAVVLAQAGDTVVMAYRGGNPGGRTVQDQAALIAAAVLEGR
jgi:hypothetical protein